MNPLLLAPERAVRSPIAFCRPSVVCSLNWVTRIDHVAGDRDDDRLVLALAHDRELDRGVHRAAHLLDRLVEGQPLDRLAVELGDDVVRQDAGLGGRRVVDRRHHLDQPAFHGDFHAQAAELALGLHLHVAETVGVHVARMRVEPGQHAVDR